MRRAAASAVLVAALGLSGGCNRQPDPQASTIPAPLPSKPADPEADDPKTGMNTERPDSPKDLKQDLNADTTTGVGTNAATSRDPNH
ncbi:MAG: hypothetical protein ABW278_05335 [Steroidobacteraceae bacterium]